jgi:transposase-like protein
MSRTVAQSRQVCNWHSNAGVRNVSLLVAIGVNDEGFGEVLAVAEGSEGSALSTKESELE